MEVFIIRDGEQMGPLNQVSVEAFLAEGKIGLEDLAWSSGLPAWLPLREFLHSSSRDSPPPSPADSPAHPPRLAAHNPSTPKQRAFLTYLGIPFPSEATREAAALLVSDALENPALFTRLTRWQAEKFRLHPETFADEQEVRKKQRANSYLELCQIEGKGIVEAITEAHCKVLIESLDNRYPSWEANPRECLWDYFLPTLAEHFPQMVTPAWRGRLKIGGTKLPAALTRGITSSSQSQEGSPARTQFQAAIRGLVYGLLALAAIFGGLTLLQNKKTGESDPPPAPREPKSSPVTAADTPPAPPPEPPSETGPAVEPAPDNSGTPPLFPDTPIVPVPKPGVPSSTHIEDSTTPAAQTAPVKETITLRKAVQVQLQFGKVTLNAGTRLKYIATEGALIRARFNNDEILLPSNVTDMPGVVPVTQ